MEVGRVEVAQLGPYLAASYGGGKYLIAKQRDKESP